MSQLLVAEILESNETHVRLDQPSVNTEQLAVDTLVEMFLDVLQKTCILFNLQNHINEKTKHFIRKIRRLH